MSAESKNQSMGSDGLSAITAFWSQWMEQSAKGTQALLELSVSAGDPATLQRRWLEVLSEQLEDFMRTPAFMEMMRRNLKAVTDMKVAQDQMVHGAARQLGMPLATDIAGLFERLHSTEQEIVARLESIEQRLNAMDAPAHPVANGKTPTARSRGSKPAK